MPFSPYTEALITGATDGIGKETAKALAGQKIHILLHGRNREKAENVREEISRSTGNKNIDILVADLSSLTQVRDLIQEVRARHRHLRILVNNAGDYSARLKLSAEGYELTFAVHYLAAFLLATGLLDLLQANAPARVVNVTSVLHHGADLDFENLRGEKGYEGHAAYATAKLALTLFTYELARRTKETGVTVNCVHPGGVNTKLLRAGFGNRGVPPEQGAESVVRLVADSDLDRVTGKYFDRKQPGRPDPRAYDSTLRARLWANTENLLKQQLKRAA